MEDKVIVGLGVVVINQKGQVLIGKRKGFAAKYSIPGGHLDAGETFEVGAVREVKEETGMNIKDPKVIAVTNNLETFRETGKHYVSVILLAKTFSDEPRVMEPEKCETWLWCDPAQLPEPHFDASSLAVKCYREGKLYAQ